MNWFPESHKRNTTKTRMFGCLVHNHADNPTMKRITWLQKRRIAKHLLLGHTRMDIWKNIMPKLYIEGQKRVDSQDVRRVHEAIQKDKHHKLREGHDIASLLGKVARCSHALHPGAIQGKEGTKFSSSNHTSPEGEPGLIWISSRNSSGI